jgi:hypothetical protein
MFLKNRKLVSVSFLKAHAGYKKGDSVEMFESTAKALIAHKIVEAAKESDIVYSEEEKAAKAKATSK